MSPPPPPGAGPARFLLGLGSNRRHGRFGAPPAVLAAALAALAREGVVVVARSAVVATPPLGPGGRRYANAAALVESALPPPALLALAKRIERAFGRRAGRRWGARVLDIDLLAWSGGRWRDRGLAIPHPAMAHRWFVLDPLMAVAPDWRLPGGASVRQLRARLTRPRPVHRWGVAVGL